jgi:FKBP-type peptidyl-prolyl cis-trans isomerase 2
MAGEDNKRKERDPIFMICLALFTIAAVAAIGVFIADHYFSSDDRVAAYGDSVSVDYTGTYYEYIGEEHAVVFDTSYSKVANDDSVKKSNEFTKRSSYSPLDFKIGGGEVLKGFESAVVGHKIGDVFRVTIPASEAYVGAQVEQTSPLKDRLIPVEQTMTTSAFTKLYGFTPGDLSTFKTVFGWDAYAQKVSDKNEVKITNHPSVGSTYTFSPGGKAPASGDERLKFTVTGIADGFIKCDFAFVNATFVSGNVVEMMGFDFGTEKWYVKEISSTDFTRKVASERVNEDLYFEIKLVSIN